MRYALIGCGRISANHIKAALANHLEIVAVCDLVAEHMESLLVQYKLERDSNILRYTDYRKMLDELDVDLIAIATESGNHAAIALDCIDKGIHLLIEKPMALSLSDADEIIRRSEQRNVKVCACHQNRFNLAIRQLRGAIESGRFGKLSHGSVHVRWNRNKEYYDQAPWRGTWAQDGGALMNQCIHGIDLLRWMLGDEIEEVYGVIKQQMHDYLETEDIGMAVVRFKNGVVGTIEGTTNVYPKTLEETLYVFGQTGTVKVGGRAVNTFDEWTFADCRAEDKQAKEIQENAANVYGNGHTPLYADMIAAIENDRMPYVDAYAGRRALELVLAIYKSSFEHRPVTLPLTDCSTLEFNGKSL